jgi:hypothetical protein
MKRIIFVVILMIGSSSVVFPEELLGKNNLEYIGAFRLPSERIGCDRWDDCVFAYGGRPIAVDSDGNDGKGSLFIGSHIYSQKIAEVSIPEPINSDNLINLKTASIIQGFYDITEGNRQNILENGNAYDATIEPGGLLVYDDKLIGSVYIYYPGPTQILSHYSSSKNLSKSGDFSGMYKIGTSIDARFLAGYMDRIPLKWQNILGGTAITGIGGLAIISTTSVGPSAFAFNPEDFGIKTPVPMTTLMYYTLDHPLIESKEPESSYNGSSHFRGVVFPDDSDSILFFGDIGYGKYCYGIGTSDPLLIGEYLPNSTTEKYECYDPSSSAKGPHMYPYKYHVWAYDVKEFIKVIKGEKHPWDILPYTTWDFELPFQPQKVDLLGTAYDRKTRRLYIVQGGGDGDKPLVHVFKIIIPPMPPENLSIKHH